MSDGYPATNRHQDVLCQVGQLSNLPGEEYAGILRVHAKFVMTWEVPTSWAARGVIPITLFFQVADWCPESLTDLVKRAPGYSIRRWVELILPVARAVAVLHEIGIVHRDLDSGNVLVTEGGQLAVSDYGIGVRLTDGHTATHTQLIGKLSILPPEGRADVAHRDSVPAEGG